MSYLDVLLGGYKTIQNNGALVAAEPTLNIVGATSIVDDSANKRTTVTLGTGITQLSGDVTAGPGSGSIAATVVKANGATVPAAGALTTGNVLQVSGASALSYGPVNLAGGANYISGTLPAGNQAAQTLGGAMSGTTAAAVIVPGAAGQIYVSNATPLAGWTSLISFETTHGRFQAGGGGSDYLAIIGPKSGNETSLAALYLLPNATAPNASNYAIYGDGANQFVMNTPGGNPTWFFQAAGTNFARLDASTSTTPWLHSDTAQTSFTVGTNKSGAALNLAAGANITAFSLSNPGSASIVAATAIGQLFGPHVNKGTNYTIDSSGPGDLQIWMTAACTITLPAPASCAGRFIEIIVGYDPASGGGTIARNAAENINGAAANITLVTGDKFSILQVRCNGTDWIIKGGLSI